MIMVALMVVVFAVVLICHVSFQCMSSSRLQRNRGSAAAMLRCPKI